jgi:glycosyltransferase involved in cell wall biosynthesis
LHWTGPVAEEDLPALYTLAEVMAFPSLVEGFGLPALEAMACGTPVLAAAASSLPEVVGDAGVLMDPYDIEGMAQALLMMLEDTGQRAAFRARGLARAATFSWSHTATQTFQAYEQAMAA